MLPDGSEPAVLVTENETNTVRLYDVENYTPFTRDAFHRYIIHGEDPPSLPLESEQFAPTG